MPMLADIEDPPRSRTTGMLVGVLVALPFAAIVSMWLLPTLVQAVLGGSRTHDERAALETAYMNAVCTQAIELPRDEQLCGCVLATEYPGLDCQAPFVAWSLDRQLEQCSDPAAKESALSFCSCVEQVAVNVSEAPDEAAAQTAAGAYRNCQTIDDAVYLPAVESLSSASMP